MSALDMLAEERIRDAQAKGEFDDLPGAGAPLQLGDDALVPEDLRTGYRLLKNAGFVPPELEAHCEIRQIEQLLRTVEDDGQRSCLLSRINFLLGRAVANRPRRDLRVEAGYYERLAEHLERRRRS